MAAFHGDARAAYSRASALTTAAAAAALVAVPVTVAAAGEPPRAAPVAFLAAVAVSTVLGAGVAPHLAGLRRAGAATAIVFALFALPAFFALDTTAAARLALLGATQFALGVALGAALGRAAAPLAAAVVAATTALPFLLARPDAPAAALRTAELLFTASPVAAAAPLVRVDLLRHPLLYENSTLGSSIPIGYPPADVLSAAAVALGGILYWVASRRTRSVKGESPAATF